MMNPKGPREGSDIEPSSRTGAHEAPPTTRRRLAAFARAAALFRALGDAERLKILEALAHREVRVTDLARGLGGKITTVSQRLRVLRTEGLVVHRREGRNVLYALADQHIADLVHHALAHVSQRMGGRR
jgi:DNA-binding transcriptional ArsR family regulator